jgi:hypothetical protein
MGKGVIQRREPLDGPRVVEVLDNVNFAPKIREELAGGNVPITIEPGPFLPAG